MFRHLAKLLPAHADNLFQVANPHQTRKRGALSQLKQGKSAEKRRDRDQALASEISDEGPNTCSVKIGLCHLEEHGPDAKSESLSQ